MGGVLIDLDIEACKKSFKEIVGYKYTDDMLDPSHGMGLYAKIEEGVISAEEFRMLIRKDSRPNVSDEEINQAMWSLLIGVQAYKIPLLIELSQQYDLFLLSNNNPISWKRCKELFEESGLPVDRIFKQSFLSFEMKKLKPCQEIFEEIISAIPEYSAEEMLFIDDSVKNTTAAARCGLQVLHFPQEYNLRDSLQKYGII